MKMGKYLKEALSTSKNITILVEPIYSQMELLNLHQLRKTKQGGGMLLTYLMGMGKTLVLLELKTMMKPLKTLLLELEEELLTLPLPVVRKGFWTLKIHHHRDHHSQYKGEVKELGSCPRSTETHSSFNMK